MNNKGQSLVIFIILLPLFLLLLAFVVDCGFLFYEKNKLTNINITTLEYAGSKYPAIDTKDIEELVLKNDPEITNVSASISKDKIRIISEKQIESIFGRIVGTKNYYIKADNSIAIE